MSILPLRAWVHQFHKTYRSGNVMTTQESREIMCAWLMEHKMMMTSGQWTVKSFLSYYPSFILQEQLNKQANCRWFKSLWHSRDSSIMVCYIFGLRLQKVTSKCSPNVRDMWPSCGRRVISVTKEIRLVVSGVVYGVHFMYGLLSYEPVRCKTANTYIHQSPFY